MENLSLPHLARQPVALVTGKPPLLLLLHGYGSNEHDLFGLAPALDPRLLVLSARAPVALGPGQFGWFQLDWTATGLVMDHAGAKASGAALAGFLAGAVDAYQADPARVYLGGFSQGAIMALGLALSRPERVAGVVAMSGRAPPPDAIELASPGRLRGLPIVVVHGTEDPVIPIEDARQSRDFLASLPVDLTYREYPIGHHSTPETLREIAAWLSGRLDARSTGSGGS
jgi:phospholipase/carboxylesterase